MTVRELVEILRNHGWIAEPMNTPNWAVDESLGLLHGAYQIRPDAEVINPEPAGEDS